jgi:hypothetical protein
MDRRKVWIPSSNPDVLVITESWLMKVWVSSSNPDVLVITETWFRKSVLNTDVDLSGYKNFRQYRYSKGGGVAIFTKDHLQWSVDSTKSVPKQFDLMVLSITLSNSSLLTVSGCYRPPSAQACILPALNSLLAPYTKSEFVLLGDLNWDMLKLPDQVLKQWDSLNLSQIITNPTRYDSKHSEKGYFPQCYPHKIILIGISLVFSVMTLVITVLQPVIVMADH